MSQLAKEFSPSNQILICDDLLTVRKVLRRQLAELGITDILEAGTGSEALNLVKAGGVRLVLSDWHMPEMTGFDLLKAIRADETNKNLPIILITSVRDRESVVNAAHSGVNGFIAKPFTKEILSDKLNSVLFKEIPQP